MAEPFTERAGATGGFLSRIPGGHKRAFLAELETRLAQASRVSDVSRESALELARRHGVDLATSMRGPRRSLYRRFLERCLADQALSPEESADLAHLRELLALADEDARAIHDDVARAFYGHALDEVLADYRLDPDEERFLEHLREQLGLDAEAAARLQEQGAERARLRFLSRAMAPTSALVQSRDTTLELSGRSALDLSDAVRQALSEAVLAAPDLRAARITEISVEQSGGDIEAWRVKLEATVPRRTD